MFSPVALTCYPVITCYSYPVDSMLGFQEGNEEVL